MRAGTLGTLQPDSCSDCTLRTACMRVRVRMRAIRRSEEDATDIGNFWCAFWMEIFSGYVLTFHKQRNVIPEHNVFIHVFSSL